MKRDVSLSHWQSNLWSPRMCLPWESWGGDFALLEPPGNRGQYRSVTRVTSPQYSYEYRRVGSSSRVMWNRRRNNTQHETRRKRPMVEVDPVNNCVRQPAQVDRRLVVDPLTISYTTTSLTLSTLFVVVYYKSRKRKLILKLFFLKKNQMVLQRSEVTKWIMIYVIKFVWSRVHDLIMNWITRDVHFCVVDHEVVIRSWSDHDLDHESPIVDGHLVICSWTRSRTLHEEVSWS